MENLKKRINQIYTEWKWRERTVSCGKEYPDRVFYVIRRANCKSGLFSYVMTTLGRIKEAVDNGFIPVVDMQNEKNMYLSDTEVGIRNAWEFFFEQPAGYSLEDIKNAKHVILGNGIIGEELDFPGALTFFDDRALGYWRTFCNRYLQVNKSLAKEFEEVRKELFGNKKVLGVLARGTDYTCAKPKGHPIQPSVEQLAGKIDEVLCDSECEMIYLVTEDADIYDGLFSLYADRIIAPDVRRYRLNSNENINDRIEKDGNAVKSGIEYLKSIWILAHCECMVAGCVSGSLGASLMTEGFEYSYIFNLGFYP